MSIYARVVFIYLLSKCCPAVHFKTAGNDGVSMEEGACIRGTPAANVAELLGPGGVGRILLGRRRLPKEGLLDAVAAEIAVQRPQAVFWRLREVPAESLAAYVAARPQAGRPAVVLIYPLLAYPQLESQLPALPADVIVLGAQELCHQVPAVLRLH